ncbi:MAG TPA: chemotaxis protein CheW [Candidatus Kapabacteria bacterium]|nr:chemotaxis protein CheW [Candidatus Kapabacteria bacterium]
MKSTNEKGVSHTSGNSDILQLVSFHIGEEEFGVDILMVKEINRMSLITKVPNAPTFVEGIINLRGKVIPIIDLREKLGLMKKEFDNHTRIIIVEIETNTIGFIVDKVNEVLRINKSVTEEPPRMVAGIESRYITSIGKLDDRMLILLDLAKILVTNEMDAIDDLVA